MESKNVSELAKQVRGVSYKPEDLHDGLNDKSVILLRANNINDGKINFDDVVYVDKSKVSKEQYLQNGDILICASSGSKQLVGKAASVDFDIECTFGAFCKVVRPNPSIAEFLGIYFQSNTYRQKVSEVAIGANINNIRNEHIDNLILSVGTDEENSEIVRMMKVIQRLIDERKQEVQELDKLVKARFVEMFGNPLHPNKYLKLGKIAILERGRFSPRPRNDPKYFNGEYPFIQTGDISSSNHRLSEYKQTLNEQGIKVSKKFCVGTIVMAIVGATIGATAILEREVYAPDSVIGITPYNYNNVFLETLLQFWQPQLLANAPECARSNINLAILGEVPIIDVDVVLQNQFADFVNQVNKSKLQVYQYMVANWLRL